MATNSFFYGGTTEPEVTSIELYIAQITEATAADVATTTAKAAEAEANANIAALHAASILDAVGLITESGTNAVEAVATVQALTDAAEASKDAAESSATSASASATSATTAANTVTSTISSLAAPEGSDLVGFSHAITYAAGTLGAKGKQLVSVMDAPFNAKGDDTTDDSAAIQAANGSGAAAIYFPPGVYRAAGLSMTVPWIMADGALIKFNGAINMPCINVTGSGLSGNLNVSAGGGSPSRLVNIEGSNNTFSKIVVRDMTSPVDASVHVALRIGGYGNSIEKVVGVDLTNTGNTNHSSPQMLTFGGASEDNAIDSVFGRNIACCVLTASTGNNTVGSIVVDGTTDNGLYCTAAGRLTVGSVRYSGSDEPVVFINGANAAIGTVIVDDAINAAVNVSDCGVVEIGALILRGNGVQGFLKTRTENISSGTVRIGSVQGEIGAGTLCFLNAGTVDHVDIGKINLNFTYDAATVGSLGSWARFNAAKSVSVGDVNIFIIDKNNVLTSSNVFIATFPATLSRPSYVGCFNVSILNADRTTFSAAIFQGKNLIQPLMTLGAGYIQANSGPNLREITSSIPNDRLYINTTPTLGTWKRGQVLYFAGTGAGSSPGVVCTTAGAPGTFVFKNLPNVAA